MEFQGKVMGWVQEGGVGGDSGRTEENEETGKRDIGEGSIQEDKGELYGPTFPPLISLYTNSTAQDGSENLPRENLEESAETMEERRKDAGYSQFQQGYNMEQLLLTTIHLSGTAGSP